MVVVGIAGGSASGKSSVASELEARLGERVSVIVHDRYYRTPPGTVDPALWNYDHPDALDTALLVEHVQALGRGDPVDVPRYDFAGHRRAEGADPILPAEVLIVEGILVLADERLRSLFDLSIFVDCAADIRLIRRLRRDVVERGRDTDSVLNQYERSVRTMHEAHVQPSKAFADLVLDGTRPLPELADAVMARLAPLMTAQARVG
jgi:uridine kinase